MSLHETSAGSLSLVSETAEENGDLVFTAEQFDRLHYQFIRNLAAEANTDEINGKSNKLEIRAYYVRQHSLTDFE